MFPLRIPTTKKIPESQWIPGLQKFSFLLKQMQQHGRRLRSAETCSPTLWHRDEDGVSPGSSGGTEGDRILPGLWGGTCGLCNPRSTSGAQSDTAAPVTEQRIRVRRWPHLPRETSSDIYLLTVLQSTLVFFGWLKTLQPFIRNRDFKKMISF